MPKRMNHMNKDGSGLKKSATTIAKSVFEASVVHTLRLPQYGLAPEYDSVRTAFRKRLINLPASDAFAGWKVAARPTGCNSVKERRVWLRQELCAPRDNASAIRSLRVSDSIISTGFIAERFVGSEAQFIYWIELWGDEELTVRKGSAGLGIAATVKLCAGRVIARGEIDDFLWWPELETLVENPKDGKWAALFGPISLLSVGGF